MAVTTINPEAEVPSRAAAALSDAQAAQPQSLPQLLAKRNVLVDAANALVDPPNEQLDEAANGYESVERAIRETPAETVDDVVAKMALIAEFVREQGCPDVDEVEAFLAEARSVLIRSCDPMRAENVARSDAHWALEPVRSDDITGLLAKFELLWSAERATVRAEAENDDPTRHREISRTATEAIEVTANVVRQIMATPATSLDDFRAKARMIDWAIGGSDGWDDGSEPVIFRPLVRQLVNELLGHAPAPVAPASAALLAAE